MRTCYEDEGNCMVEGFSIQCKVQAHAERIIKTGIDKSAQSPALYPKV